MIIFCIHLGRAKAGALSRAHSIPLHPELGKVVTRDALMSSELFTTSAPLHTPFCVYQDWLILRLHPRMASTTIPYPYPVTWSTCHMGRSTEGWISLTYHWKSATRCKNSAAHHWNNESHHEEENNSACDWNDTSCHWSDADRCWIDAAHHGNNASCCLVSNPPWGWNDAYVIHMILCDGVNSAAVGPPPACGCGNGVFSSIFVRASESSMKLLEVEWVEAQHGNWCTSASFHAILINISPLESRGQGSSVNDE